VASDLIVALKVLEPLPNRHSSLRSTLPVLKVRSLLRVVVNYLMIVNLVFPHIINACVFTSAFSAGSSGPFIGSRILYGLALRGQAPRIFTYCTKNGLPIVAVLASVSVPRVATRMTTHL
jgi:L-asparagine transporter-like permease